MQNPLRHSAFPAGIKTNLFVEPALQPSGFGSAALDGVIRKQRLIHVQIGGVEGLGGAPCAGHEHPDLGKCGTRGMTCGEQRLFHVAQIGTAMTGFVFGNGVVDLLDHGFGVPLGGASIPMIQANLPAKVKHQRFQSGGRIELKSHGVQLGFAGHQLRSKAS